MSNPRNVQGVTKRGAY